MHAEWNDQATSGLRAQQQKTKQAVFMKLLNFFDKLFFIPDSNLGVVGFASGEPCPACFDDQQGAA